jgi:hypothetical protein
MWNSSRPAGGATGGAAAPPDGVWRVVRLVTKWIELQNITPTACNAFVRVLRAVSKVGVAYLVVVLKSVHGRVGTTFSC